MMTEPTDRALYARINGLLPMSSQDRATFVIRQMLEGTPVGDTNRQQVSDYLALHFQYLTDGAARREAIEERDERLRQIRTWCDAYPVDVFPEPDLAAAKAALGDDQYSSLHAAWARRLLAGIRDLAEPAEPK
jgi:hypothetical protein